ncbi:hypothetical protein CROQUDRAFT_92051 [Cronartium quercuum f. sp. fusiforme G11]|uniref:Small ribosomal subunit protein uS10 domain-containing protein n=1 Tax=Cronartium quercuum f. sp. fusiforme G11 TaxID=708437 RepID=A0A9P6NJ27_9BASI|nr:hypothetical protein CROQUDRAFT_92051 [Cronartium quercuum f. sp. fusiforme G11]
MATTLCFKSMRGTVTNLNFMGTSIRTRRAFSTTTTTRNDLTTSNTSSIDNITSQELDSLESLVSHLNDTTNSIEKPSLTSDDLNDQPTTPNRIPPSPSWAMRLHPELYDPPTLKPTHKLHVATLAFEAYNPDKAQLPLVTGFALQAAYHLGIPVTKPASMPIKTELHTVLRSGFVHKKSQENIWRLTHRRIIKAYDTNEEVINRWINYLRDEGVRGTNVGIKAQRFLYRKINWGEDLNKLSKQEIQLNTLENMKKNDSKKKKKKVKKNEKVILDSQQTIETAGIDPTTLENINEEGFINQSDQVKLLAQKLIEKELKPKAEALESMLKETGLTKGKVLSELKLKQE